MGHKEKLLHQSLILFDNGKIGRSPTQQFDQSPARFIRNGHIDQMEQRLRSRDVQVGEDMRCGEMVFDFPQRNIAPVTTHAGGLGGFEPVPHF